MELNRKLDEIIDNLRCSLPIHGLADSETYTLPNHHVSIFTARIIPLILNLFIINLRMMKT